MRLLKQPDWKHAYVGSQTVSQARIAISPGSTKGRRKRTLQLDVELSGLWNLEHPRTEAMLAVPLTWGKALSYLKQLWSQLSGGCRLFVTPLKQLQLGCKRPSAETMRELFDHRRVNANLFHGDLSQGLVDRYVATSVAKQDIYVRNVLSSGEDLDTITARINATTVLGKIEGVMVTTGTGPGPAEGNALMTTTTAGPRRGRLVVMLTSRETAISGDNAMTQEETRIATTSVPQSKE